MKSLYWIRRDFRVDDNPALYLALQQGCRHAIYLTATKTWQAHNAAPIQVDFIERHLNAFIAQLNTLGITVQVIECSDFNEQREVITEFYTRHQFEHVFANQEIELREQQRDSKLQQSINLSVSQCDTILPHLSVLNKSGEMFKVFTPYKKAWLQNIHQSGYEQGFLGAIKVDKANTNQQAPVSLNFEKNCSRKWPLASTVLDNVLESFMRDKLPNYAEHRDIPSIKGTSGLSPYFSIGAISPRRVLHQLLNHYPTILENSKAPLFSWLNELIWREFYRNLLVAYPRLCKHTDFQTKFASFIWPNQEQLFKAWCEGKTGYPIIDAAMRQLQQTGWMHNRLRMIVASFLTKHLLIDWRWGEAFFMRSLIDGDLAANSGGWQWSAGTGCDAQPYFRIFNPVTQSKKFDPHGHFIRKYLPELVNVPDKEIHLPHAFLAKQNQSTVYWPTIVDLSEARKNTLDYFSQQLNKVAQ